MTFVVATSPFHPRLPPLTGRHRGSACTLGGTDSTVLQKRGGAGRDNIPSLCRPLCLLACDPPTVVFIPWFRPPDLFVRAPLMWIYGLHFSPTPPFRVLSSAPIPASFKKNYFAIPRLTTAISSLFPLPFRPALFTCSLERRSFAVGEERLRQKVLGDR